MDQACGTDAELRRRVEALLASDQNQGEILARPLGAVAASVGFGESGRAGRRIGSYQIVRELGSGGMGTVYLAERADGHYRKQVPIKLVKVQRGTEDLVRRFRNERQALRIVNSGRFLTEQ